MPRCCYVQFLSSIKQMGQPASHSLLSVSFVSLFFGNNKIAAFIAFHWPICIQIVMFTEIWGGAAWFSQRSFFLSFVLFYPSTPSDMRDIQISFGRKWSTRDQKPKSSLWSKLAFDSTLKAHTTTTVASFTHEEPINQHKENIFPTFPVALFFTIHQPPTAGVKLSEGTAA